MKYVVIGGVAAGMSGASKIVREDSNATVHTYEKGGYFSYGTCTMPYFVAGYKDDPKTLIARSQESFKEAGIDLFAHHKVLGVDAANKQVFIRHEKTGEEFADSYDKLLIACGAKVVVPDIPGIHSPLVHYLFNMEDALRLKEGANKPGVARVVIIGGGYVGAEAVEAMLTLKKDVTLIEQQPRILPTFDEEIAQIAHEELLSKGVAIQTGETVKSIAEGARPHVVTDKREYPADLVIVATGIRPATAFLQDTGIAMEPNGAIQTDRQMRTNIPDIYAAGDCATVYDSITQKNIYWPMATVANKCGRLAGNNMAGGEDAFFGTVRSAALKLCDLELGRTGLREEEARQLGFDIKSRMIKSTNHSSYFDGHGPLWIKLVYERESLRLLGAQLCGNKGTALRTNIYAIAIERGMTTQQIGQSDLIFAPPFSNVWDAVHIAGNVSR